MTDTLIKCIGGPKDSDTYPVGKYDAIPSRISNRNWSGHYDLRTASGISVYQWVGTRGRK